MLCALCNEINVTELVRLAQANSGILESDQQKWKHHSTYDDIVVAAQAGCELCKLLLSFMDRRVERPPWDELTYKEAFLEDEKHGTSMGLSVSLSSSRNGGDREVLDQLLFGFGSHGDVPLVLSLQTPRDGIKFVEGSQIGHFTLDPNLGSETNCKIARDWLKTCSEMHYECPSIEDKHLPSRVVHVGTDDRDPYIFQTGGMKGKYIALSHCWGGWISVALTTETIKGFTERIPMADLPATFRDAVVITRKLGFEYLWIDCLCILQDSSEDWEVESKHMGNVYHDATLTIAASTASKSTDGILHTFTDHELSGISISLKLSKDGNPTDHVDLVLPNTKREDLGDLLRDKPLATRGWTLQEEVLSPRTLFYGSQQIYWQCLHDYEAADGLRPWQIANKRAFRYEQIKDRIHVSQGLQNPRLIKSNHVSKGRNQPQALHAARTCEKIIGEYHRQMVVDYCSRNLTRTSDKFVAFSGIVILVRNVLRANGFPNAMYVAGIWSSHFRQGLIWYYADDARPSVERAPSWSWATTNGKIAFHKTAFISDFASTALDPVLVSHDVELAGRNPFGEIKNASIVIAGSAMVMRGVDDIISNNRSKPSGYIHWDVRVDGTGRRKTALFTIRLGDSSMFLFNPHPRKTDLADGSGPIDSNMEGNKRFKANNVRYKVLFVATQGRQAHGLVLRLIPGDGHGSDGNRNGTAKATVRARNVGADEKEESNLGDDDTPIKTYRRVGYVWLSERHANGNSHYDAYKWAECLSVYFVSNWQTIQHAGNLFIYHRITKHAGIPQSLPLKLVPSYVFTHLHLQSSIYPAPTQAKRRGR
ncbi:hypothetical protein EYC84_000900 [Monilinia fructicola]|uniref:Heterokaryon incompatibility domain-containing protein n=1 Tax=Monilinia fructicola TaxID=38448 RepID=A0A5M9JLH3_MONFR|nr:hypothetical protein EYC84_000900 [Monilinia fructicola]